MVEDRNRKLTRRELLAGVVATGVGSLAGCEHDGPTHSKPEGLDVDPDPGWRANYDTYVRSVATDLGRESLVRTSTTLEYLDVTWEEVGNPASEENAPDGAWKHTFGWSSTGLTFLRDDPSEPWSTALEYSQTVLEMNNRFAVNGHHEDPVIDDPRYVPTEEWTDDIAVSVRRDPNLFAFLDSGKFEEALAEVDQEARDELAANPKGITTSNATKVKRAVEKNNTLKSYGFTILGWVMGAIIGKLSLGTGVGLVVGIVISVVSWMETDFSVFGFTPDPDLEYNKGVSNYASKRGRGRTVGHYAVFDVYVTPDSTGQFTVQSQHDSSPASGASYNGEFDQLDGDSIRSLWTVTVDPLPPKDQLTQTTTEANEIPESEKFTASITTANFKDNENETVSVGGEQVGEAVLKPRPKPGIAGPLRKIPPGQPMEYSADQTVLASAPVASYEWRAYRVPESHWMDALEATITTDDAVENASEALFERLTEALTPDATGRGKFPEITYDEPGRYLLTLEVTDKHGHRGVTAEFVDVDTLPPEPKITVEQSDSGGTVLSAERTAVPDGDASDLSYDWLVVGPLSELIAGTAGTTGLFSTIGVLLSPAVRSESGMEVPLTSEQGTYVAILTVTNPSGTWVSTMEVLDAGLFFYDDWEDGTYTTDPTWGEPSEADNDSIEVVNGETPDGGSKVLRLGDQTASSVNLLSKEIEAELTRPWKLEGLLNPRRLPGVGEDSLDCTYHDLDVGVTPVRLRVSAYDPYDEATEPIRIVGHSIDSTTRAEPILQEDEWYRYELEFDGTDTYTGRLWPDSGSKEDGVTVTATGKPVFPPASVLLRATGDNGGGICGDNKSEITVDHAFVRLTGTPDTGTSEE